MQDADFPYSVPIRLHVDQSDVEISAPVVMFLPTNKTTNDVVVLAGTMGSTYDQGLYITTNGKTWRFIAPFAVLNRSVYRGYEISVYTGLSAPVAPAASAFMLYKNGVESGLISPIPAEDSAVYVTVRSIDASLDETGKIPMDQLPDAIKGGLRWAGNTAPYSGFYDANSGIDTGTNQQIPSPSSSNSGMYWVVTVAGSQWGYTLTPGDWLVSNGVSYQWVDGGAQPVASYTNRGVVQIQEDGGVLIDSNGLISVDPTKTGGVKTVNSQEPDAAGNVLVNTADIPGLQALLDSKVKQVNAVMPVDGVLTLVALDIGALDVSLRGAPNGVASLDANGTVPISQLPASILGALRYKGAYDAATNTPALPTPDSTNLGFYWVVNVAGTQQGFDLKIGDWIVSNGTSYDVIDNQNAVSSVNGQIGVVVLKVADIEGAVASVNGVTPNASGEVTVPFATTTVAGTVKVPLAGGLTIAGDGSLALSADLLSKIGFTPVRVLYVSLNGDPTTGDGKINNPLTTISDAVTAAVDGTAIVVLSPGTFNENIQIVDKQIALLSGLGSAGDQAPVTVSGFLKIGGSKPISVQDLRLSWTGVGAAFRVFNSGATLAVRNLSISSSSASVAVQTNESEGAWSGGLLVEGLYVNDGKIQIDAGNVSIRLAPQPSNSIFEVNGGFVELANVWGLQRINHTGGRLYAEKIRRVGTSNSAPAIVSTATSADNGFLSLIDVSTWVNDSVQSYVSKTGDCPYVIDGVTRNIASDVWTGIETAKKTRYDQDVIVTHLGINYTGVVGAYLASHLQGIDEALAARLSSITSASGTSLVSDSAAGVLKGLEAGAGITLTPSSTAVQISSSAIQSLSSVAGGTSLVNDAVAGQLRAIAAGSGMSITEAGGVITFASVAGAGVSSLNTLNGDVVLEVGSGMSLVAADQTITLANTGVLGLSSVGEISLISNASGILKGLKAGTNVTITENAGILTISSTGGGTSGVSSFNATTGDIVFAAGSGMTLDQSGNTFTLSFTGVPGSGVQSVTATDVTGATLINDDGSTSHMAVLKRLIAGNGVTLDESTTGITINAPGGVTSVNGTTGDVNVVGGTDISVTVDESGNVTIGYTGSATGTKVDSINGIYGPVTLASGTSNLTIAEASGTFTFSVAGFLNSVNNATSTDPTAVPLVSDDGTTGGVALIRRIIPGANVNITSDSGAITIDVTAGGGTVKSVNNILPDNPDSGNVTLGAGDVGALALVGGTMLGNIDMDGNAIKNVPNAVDPGDPITLAFLSSGDIIIDNGEI